LKDQGAEIARGIRANWKSIRAAERSTKRLALDGFPFDAWLLRLSPLYRRSRSLYLESGGRFRSAVTSSPRTLSSGALLSQMIEYTPIADELYWSATDRVERGSPRNSHARILELRSWCAPVFHEQSHRLIWKFLPPPPHDRRSIHRYLNFCEALVVATDMALGDHLGPRLSRLFYLSGATYDPGTDSLKRLPKGLRPRRAYRNLLQAAVQATYLNLELFAADDIHQVIRHLHGPGHAATVDRCLRLDRGFVEITNIVWQEKNWRKLRPVRARTENPLTLPADPLDHRLIYLWSEKWFEKMGL
jgi:hypothetical protein